MTALVMDEIQSTLSWPASWGPAPRFATPRTPERPTFGPQVRRIAHLMGLKRLRVQEYIWDVALEVQSEEAGDPAPGNWAYDTVDITLPRRGSKSVTVQPVVVHRAELIRRATIFMTAQNGKAASRRWLDLADTIEDSYLGDRVRKRVSVGSERLTWTDSKSVLEPFSPKEDATHGDEPDLVLADEIWKYDLLQGKQLDSAIRPTFLTNNAQFWRYSTAGTTASAYYNLSRKTGRKAVLQGRRLGRFYIEFSVPDVSGGVKVEDLDDEALIDLIVKHHPRSDIDMRAFLRDELTNSQDEDGDGRSDFLRAYGNHTIVDVSHEPLVSAPVMARGLVRDQIPEGVRVGLAVDVDPEKRQASINAAWRDETGKALTTVIRCDVGTRWVAQDAAGIFERGLNEYPHVAVNDTTVTRDVMDQLMSAGVPILKLNMKEYSACCNRWYDETTAVDAKKAPDPTVLHNGDPHLLEAVADAGWRRAGDGRAFGVRVEPITALTGTALALWAFDHLPEPEIPLGPFVIR